MAGYEPLSRDELLALLAERDREIARLRADNAALAARVARLERLISRNSGNSSMPPSSDDVLPGRSGPKAGPSRRGGAAGRRRDKQPGAQGCWLGWADVPDKTVCHRPRGRCGCGADLAAAADVGIERSHQVHDLPPVAVEVTQHDVWRVRCGCGREHVAPAPAGVPAAPSSYGVNLRALVVYLIIYQHVPVERCVQLIADLTGGTGPSAGFVHGMLARCATVLAEVVKLIHAVRDVHVSDAVRRYAVDLVTATRDNRDLRLGASPRLQG